MCQTSHLQHVLCGLATKSAIHVTKRTFSTSSSPIFTTTSSCTVTLCRSAASSGRTSEDLLTTTSSLSPIVLSTRDFKGRWRLPTSNRYLQQQRELCELRRSCNAKTAWMLEKHAEQGYRATIIQFCVGCTSALPYSDKEQDESVRERRT